MWYFELSMDVIYGKDEALEDTPWSKCEIWGIKLGNRWCLDYTWKLMFGISDEDWLKTYSIKTDQDFYDFCKWLGVRYKMNGKIYHNIND